MLRDALGADAGRMHFAAMTTLGRNPACIIPAWREFVRDGGDGPLLGIGEPVWPERSPAELVECRRHEALLNVAFDGDGDDEWRLLCPYDSGALDPGVLADARHNHPHVSERGVSRPSDDYVEAAAMLAWDGPLPAPAAEPAELTFGPDDLQLVRRMVGERAGGALDRERLADLVLAVDELATNTIRHGGGRGILRSWREDGAVLVEVADAGCIEDPLVGRERPPLLANGGRGLWIVNQLCDLVQVRSSPAGTVIRLHMSV